MPGKILGTIVFLLLIGAIVAGCRGLSHSGSKPLAPASDRSLRLATYNVHYIVMNRETGPWSLGDWERRKRPLDLAFKALGSDVVAFQEMESFSGGDESNRNLTLDWLLERNPSYRAAAVGEASVFPITQPILFRASRLTLLDQGWFFFSDTPDVIYSRTFNGSYPAFASWAEFRDQTNGETFHIMNVHFDYRSRSNRLKSAALVASRLRQWIKSGKTVFLAGDVNARAGSRTVEILREAGLIFTPVPGATYHFNRGINLFGAIDHIAYSGMAQPIDEPVVLRRKFDGEWPTDHYPVVVDFRLEQVRRSP